MNCPKCGGIIQALSYFDQDPLLTITVSVCQHCNSMIRVFADFARPLTEWEMNHVEMSNVMPTLRTMQLRNSCVRKSDAARYN